MLGKEQMQSFTVDDEAQEEWASEVRRFHDSAKIEVVDILGQSHTLLEIDTETSSWPLFRVQAVSIVLSTPSRNTRWPCTCGPTTLLHIRVDGRGQIEVWSGTVAVAKYFDVEASPEDWVPGLVHVDASRVRDLATLLASDHASMLRSLDMGGAGLLVDLKPIEQLFGLVLLNLHSCENISNRTYASWIQLAQSLDF